MILPDPKQLPHSILWRIIQNVFPEYAPKELQDWYHAVEIEFDNRKDVVLQPIMDCR